jgi:ubiquinone/menaquinone biosynthesis C-methylase UbiE
MFDRLDVGCGTVATGDVNCDLFLKNVGHRGKTAMPILLAKTKNFVLCDVQYLPFKNGGFNMVYCSHVIEHVVNPSQLFRELLRVSLNQVVIKCPVGLTERMKFFGKQNRFHRTYFKQRWFVHAARVCGVKEVVVGASEYFCFPHQFLPWLRLPFEFTVTLTK